MVSEIGKKAARDLGNISSAAKKIASDIASSGNSSPVENTGIDCGQLREVVPHFNKAPSEKSIEGQNNSCVVLGRDRVGSVSTGYGGKGDTQCGMIDLVVGRMSGPEPWPGEFKYPGSETPKKIPVDPIFTYYKSDKPVGAEPVRWCTDSARVYISQKTDVDENFGLIKGKAGILKRKSAIALKADGVRIMANEGMKLITNSDGYNSYGAPIETTPGIDLIAGNRNLKEPKHATHKSLQPFVKGENLRDCVNRIIDEVRDLNSIVTGLIKAQEELNKVFGKHRHPPPVLYSDIFPQAGNIDVSYSTNSKLRKSLQSLQNQMTNLEHLENQFTARNAPDYICSRYNNVN
jgi:hypothetical protein